MGRGGSAPAIRSRTRTPRTQLAARKIRIVRSFLFAWTASPQISAYSRVALLSLFMRFSPWASGTCVKRVAWRGPPRARRGP